MPSLSRECSSGRGWTGEAILDKAEEEEQKAQGAFEGAAQEVFFKDNEGRACHARHPGRLLLRMVGVQAGSDHAVPCDTPYRGKGEPQGPEGRGAEAFGHK